MKNMKGPFFSILLSIAVGACLLIATYNIGSEPTSESQTESVEESSEEAPVQTKIIEVEKQITSKMLQDRLEQIGELATEEYSFTEVAQYDSSKKFLFLKYGESSFLYSYDGTIKAGVDFSQVSVEKNDEKKTILVTVPAPKILSAELDFDSFKLYEEKSSIWNPISVSDVNAADKDLLEHAKASALEKGILENAKENAKNMITNVLAGALDAADYEIEVSFTA